MFIKGKYNTAKVFTNIIEDEAAAQIKELCDRPEFKDSQIRIMPDVHTGKGCTIGTTMTFTDKVVPNLVGVDIGCGVLVVKFEGDIPLDELDVFIKNNIPSGFGVRSTPYSSLKTVNIEGLNCIEYVNIERAKLSLGTLGGGNHFIEIDKDTTGNNYLIIHSGSRNLGKQVAEYYQELAYKTIQEERNNKIREKIDNLKAAGMEYEIEDAISKIKSEYDIPKHLAYLTGDNMTDYLSDVYIVQQYAAYNRETIADIILNHFEKTAHINKLNVFETVHNYIEMCYDYYMLRKGAVASYEYQPLLIPLNMRDGLIIVTGKQIGRAHV